MSIGEDLTVSWMSLGETGLGSVGGIESKEGKEPDRDAMIGIIISSHSDSLSDSASFKRTLTMCQHCAWSFTCIS